MIIRSHAALLLPVLCCWFWESQAEFQSGSKGGLVSLGGGLRRGRGSAVGGVTRRRRHERSRTKRGWVWNQFFVLEEYMGSEPQYVGKLHSDMDHGQNAVKYTLSGEGAGSIFTIDQLTGDIHALVGLDREERSFYTLKAQALDSRTGLPLEPESEFIVKVQDINDNEPRFTEGPYSASVPEMSPTGTYVTQVTATDADDPTYGSSAGSSTASSRGSPTSPWTPRPVKELLLVTAVGSVFKCKSDFLLLRAFSGVIRTALPNMDREVKAEYQVLLQAKDMGGQLGGLASTTTVNITLSDVNDNPPRFAKSIFHLRVPESSPAGSSVGRIRAHDADTGDNAVVEYSIVPGEEGDMFEMSSTGQDGVVLLKKVIQVVSAVDQDQPSLGQRFFFKSPKELRNRNFTIRDFGNNTAGIVTRRSGFLRHLQEEYLLPVLVEDSGYPAQSSTSTLTIRVCSCGTAGALLTCSAQAVVLPVGLSTGALMAILLCVALLIVMAVLFVGQRRHKQKEALMTSKEDIRDNVIHYDDEGGGEQDTRAYDMGTLRTSQSQRTSIQSSASTSRKDRPCYGEGILLHLSCRENQSVRSPDIHRQTANAVVAASKSSAKPGESSAEIIRSFIEQRLGEGQHTAPAYDSLATYAYEGRGRKRGR
ncbi:hypothetical protein WMY93_000492 [Mugilogobius chulae]|uniref:Cadherin domain-containing protein n=1 Tax=Mugilogobius chulae TaxID=88201 RepID=A0AAW0QEE1_9GOBI